MGRAWLLERGARVAGCAWRGGSAVGFMAGAVSIENSPWWGMTLCAVTGEQSLNPGCVSGAAHEPGKVRGVAAHTRAPAAGSNACMNGSRQVLENQRAERLYSIGRWQAVEQLPPSGRLS